MRTVEDTLTRSGREIREAADRRRLPPWSAQSRRTVVRVATAVATALVLVGAIGIPALWSRSSDVVGPEAAGSPPDGFGTWEMIAEAPILPRPHAVSVWTGTEAVFWAGSSLSRGFAYTDGAAYDPIADTWHTIPVPGWGHPGLSGVYLDGELYALAKGGGSRFDPTNGTWADLPLVEGMFLASAVATDEAVWGMGPASLNTEGQTDVAIARFDPQADDWVYGPVFEGTPATGSLFQNGSFIDQPALWTGSEIVLWNPEGGGAAFNPSTETWQQIPAPDPETGRLVTSKATVAASDLVVIAEVDGDDGIAMARYRDGTWTWRHLGMSVDLEHATVAAAGDWMLLFAPGQAPTVVHVPSGAWTRDTEARLAGWQAPNTVWTGDRLIVWGGAGTATESGQTPAGGAIWTPPAG
jgi:hypothetical protein